MNDQPATSTEHFGQRLSDVYDERIRKFFPECDHLHKMAQYLLANSVQENARILVTGVGTGHEAIAYAQEKPKEYRWL